MYQQQYVKNSTSDPVGDVERNEPKEFSEGFNATHPHRYEDDEHNNASDGWHEVLDDGSPVVGISFFVQAEGHKVSEEMDDHPKEQAHGDYDVK